MDGQCVRVLGEKWTLTNGRVVVLGRMRCRLLGMRHKDLCQQFLISPLYNGKQWKLVVLPPLLLPSPHIRTVTLNGEPGGRDKLIKVTRYLNDSNEVTVTRSSSTFPPILRSIYPFISFFFFFFSVYYVLFMYLLIFFQANNLKLIITLLYVEES